MKSLILAIASFLTVVLLFTQNALAAQEGGAVLAGDNEYDTLVPGADGQGVAAPGIACSTCRTHVTEVGIKDFTNPAAQGKGSSESQSNSGAR